MIKFGTAIRHFMAKIKRSYRTFIYSKNYRISEMSCLSSASNAAMAPSNEGRAAARSDSASAAILPEILNYNTKI